MLILPKITSTWFTYLKFTLTWISSTPTAYSIILIIECIMNLFIIFMTFCTNVNNNTQAYHQSSKNKEKMRRKLMQNNNLINTIMHTNNLLKPSKVFRLILFCTNPSFITNYFYAKPHKRWKNPVFLRKLKHESLKLQIDKKNEERSSLKTLFWSHYRGTMRNLSNHSCQRVGILHSFSCYVAHANYHHMHAS